MRENKSLQWHDAMRSAGHSPVLDEDGLMAILPNGPACQKCGRVLDWNAGTASIPNCPAAGSTDRS